MPTVTPLQNAFNAGEISPRVLLRTDIDRYYKSAEKLENFIVLTQGGITRRPGTRDIAAAKTTSGITRFIPFEFNAEQAYILEIGQGYIRFFTRQAQLMNGAVPFEIVSPWNNFDPFLLRWAQSGDTIRFVHPDFPPTVLSRLGDTNWSIGPIEFQGGPFLPVDSDGVTIQITAGDTAGQMTLSASANIFQSSHAGSLWRLGDSRGVLPHPTWTPGLVLSAGDFVVFGGNVYFATAAGTTGNIAPTHEEGTVSDGEVDLAFDHNGFGTVKIDLATSPSTALATKQGPGRVPTQVTIQPTKFWQEGAWSGFRGYPRAISIFEQRVVYADSGEPTLRYSRTGDFDNFEPPGLTQDTVNDDPIDGTLDSGQEIGILWMVSRDSLLVGTSGGSWAIRSSSGGPITPNDIRARRVTSTRAGDIDALFVRSSVLFAARGKEKFHELVFDFNSDNFETPDLSKLADHILTSGIVQMAYQQEPESIIWLCLQDGSLISVSYDKIESVVAWARHPMPGRTVESVMTIPGSLSANNEQNDEVWLIVNDGTNRRVEIMEPLWRGTAYGDQLPDAYFVDSGVRYSGAPTTTITGLGHLNGTSVNIFADGVKQDPQVVVGGSVTLASAASKASVGRPMRSFYKSVKIEGGSPIGTAIGKKRVVSEMMISLLDSCDVLCGMDTTELETVEGYTTDGALLTGDYRVNPCHDWREDRDPRVYVEASNPCPATVLAIAPRHKVENA